MTESNDGWAYRYLDWKTLVVALAMFGTLLFKLSHDPVTIGDESVYKRTGTIAKVVYCSMGKGTGSASLVDRAGREINFTVGQCRNEELSQYVGGKYVAYFTRKMSDTSPIQLTIGDSTLYEAGTSPVSITANLFLAAMGGMLLTLVFMLLRHFASGLEEAR